MLQGSVEASPQRNQQALEPWRYTYNVKEQYILNAAIVFSYLVKKISKTGASKK
jgi:hypothetical protein